MSRYGRDSDVVGKVYVGDLPRDASEKELERAFRLVKKYIFWKFNDLISKCSKQDKICFAMNSLP